MDYYQGYEDAMRQLRVRRGAGVAGFVTRLIFSVLYSAFVYAPLLILGYIVATRISHLYSNDLFIKSGLTFLMSYLLFAFFYFLKGLLIALRNAGRFSWVILWPICVVATCGVQAIASQLVFENIFTERRIANYHLWSWLSAAATAGIIYSHYRFLTNIAPASVFWAYQFGFFTTHSVSKRGNETSTPKKSASYFQNVRMKVSYKK